MVRAEIRRADPAAYGPRVPLQPQHVLPASHTASNVGACRARPAAAFRNRDESLLQQETLIHSLRWAACAAHSPAY